MSLPKNILKKRLRNFQSKFSSRGIDAVMLRTLSSYAYFTGIKWLRPALFIPEGGEPIAFIVKGEENIFKKLTWIDNMITFTDGADLMAKVTKTIREHGVKSVGMEFGVERDAYVFFYEMFKKLNPKVEVIDVSDIIAEMRMLKDDYEIEAIKEAGKKTSRAIIEIIGSIKPGLSETEIAAKLYFILYELGCENPHVYVNAGPHPRIHCEPLRGIIAREDSFVTIIIGADHNGYYANISRSIYLGKPNGLVEKLIECTNRVYETAIKLTKPGTKFVEVIKALDKVYDEYGFKKNRLIGYAHGVGLQVEEPPITTIVPVHRYLEVKPRMVLAMVHSPIFYNGLGQIKREDTFIVNPSGELEQITGFQDC